MFMLRSISILDRQQMSPAWHTDCEIPYVPGRPCRSRLQAGAAACGQEPIQEPAIWQLGRSQGQSEVGSREGLKSSEKQAQA